MRNELDVGGLDAEPVETRVDAGALSVGALLYGDESAPPIVIMHGQADSAWSMDAIARPLADRYRVVSLDLRGHGASDRGAYTLLHMIGDLCGVIDELGLIDPVVIGHSLGGQVVAQFCGLYPEVPKAAVLIEAVGPPPHRMLRSDPDGYERTWSRLRVERIRSRAAHRPSANLSEAVRRFQRAHPLLDPERAAFLAEKGTAVQDDGTRIWRFDPASRDWIAGHDHDRAEQRWQGITCPVQIILGSDSWERFWKQSVVDSEQLDGPLSDDELRRRLANFADHRYVEIAGAGHMVHYDRPVELNRTIDTFLEEIVAFARRSR